MNDATDLIPSILENSTVLLASSLIDHELLVMQARGEKLNVAVAGVGAVLAIVNALQDHGYSTEDIQEMLFNISQIDFEETE